MTEEDFSTSTKRALMPVVIKELCLILMSMTPSAIAYFYSMSTEIVSSPQYTKYSLALLAVLSWTTILFFILWVRYHRQYGRFRQAFGVLWDKDFGMHCLSCHKPLKYSSIDPSILNCSDRKCDNKHVLRDKSGQKITEQRAIELIKNSSLAVPSDAQDPRSDELIR